MSEIADVSKHLTPATLRQEMRKFPAAVPVNLYHMKPPTLPQLRADVAALSDPRIRHPGRRGRAGLLDLGGTVALRASGRSPEPPPRRLPLPGSPARPSGQRPLSLRRRARVEREELARELEDEAAAGPFGEAARRNRVAQGRQEPEARSGGARLQPPRSRPEEGERPFGLDGDPVREERDPLRAQERPVLDERPLEAVLADREPLRGPALRQEGGVDRRVGEKAREARQRPPSTAW